MNKNTGELMFGGFVWYSYSLEDELHLWFLPEPSANAHPMTIPVVGEKAEFDFEGLVAETILLPRQTEGLERDE